MESELPNTRESSIYTPSLLDEPLRQGEILSNLVQLKLDLNTISGDVPEFEPRIHPYAIIVSQDCDLDWDFRARQGQSEEHKIIPNILFCEVDTALNLAKQILKVDQAKDVKKSRTWSRIKINKDERYHFLQQVETYQDATSIRPQK